MPELPEAETIGRALSRVLTGRSIVRVEIFSPSMREPLTPLFEAGLEGLSFTGIRRRARYLLAGLSDGRALLMHFGMTGVVRVESPAVPRRKHEHVFIHLSDGNVFRFECVRRFSSLKVVALTEPDDMPAELAGFGAEPLEEEFHAEYLFGISRNRTANLKCFLMDNRFVVGVGNIYATEALFEARISPLRTAGSLSKRECEALVKAVKRILNRAIELGGSSISDFLHVDGSEGRFAQELEIYGRTGKLCKRCGTPVQAVKLGGRTSAHCPKCQKR